MSKNLFNDAYDSIRNTVSFNELWVSENPGHLANVSSDKTLVLKPGDFVKTLTTDFRKCVLVGTRLGPVVIYQRYARDEGTIVAHIPEAIQVLYGRQPSIITGLLPRNYDFLEWLLGAHFFENTNNVGNKIEKLLDAVSVTSRLQEAQLSIRKPAFAQ